MSSRRKSKRRRAGGHPARVAAQERSDGRRAGAFGKKRVTVYTTAGCVYCGQAKSLLKKRGIAFKTVDLTGDPSGQSALVRKTGMRTFPQILVDGKTLGGYRELATAIRRGTLDHLMPRAPAEASEGGRPRRWSLFGRR